MMAGRPKKMAKRVVALDERLGAWIADLWELCPEEYKKTYGGAKQPTDRVTIAWHKLLEVSSVVEVSSEELVDAMNEKVRAVEAERRKSVVGGAAVRDEDDDADDVDDGDDEDVATGEESREVVNVGDVPSVV